MRSSLPLLVLLFLTFFAQFQAVQSQTDPVFHDQANITQFFRGILDGLGLKEGANSDIESITSEQFSLDQFMFGLDLQGLSKMIPEKEELGINKIGQALKQFKSKLPNMSKQLFTVVSASLEVFGNYSDYSAMKINFQKRNPDADVASFLWDALDFISLTDGFKLSGKVVGTVVKQMIQEKKHGPHD